MNYKMIGKILSKILIVEAFFMLPSVGLGLYDGDTKTAAAFAASIGVTLLVSLLLFLVCRRPRRTGFYAREGMVCVSLCWILMSLLGCLPFFLSGEIPNYADALFEIVSGFTTTGASIVPEVEALTRAALHWRSFSHWLGGMGVLVFLLAIVTLGGSNTGYTMHLLRAESPGPNVGKLMPRMKQTAGILYLMYFVLTIADILFLLAGGMPLFEALCTAYGTAGTGGFGIKNDSMGSFSPYLQNVTTVFMILFGVNFSCYYMLIIRQFKEVLKDEELRLYLGVIAVSTAAIAGNIRSLYGSVGEALRHAVFQVGSIITTTGYTTVDFDQWPVFSKEILLFLMVIGACAGSTGGGFKCGRLLLLLKALRRNIHRLLNPQRIQLVRINGQPVSESVLDNANAYLAAYMVIVIVSFLAVSVDGFSVETNLSAILACFNNIGPGLDAVGPTANFSGYGIFSTLILTLDMLAGRLEIFPLLILFTKGAWRRR